MDTLQLKWVDYKTQNKYPIGTLSRDKENHKYYCQLEEKWINDAVEVGFSTATLPFSDVNKIYESEVLFPFFRRRVPNIENFDEDDLEILLEEVGLEEFDEFEFFRKTKGESPTDYFILE